MSTDKLNVGDFGDNVARLHEKLKASGFEVSPEEVKRKFFGPATRDAVRECQTCHGLEATGKVDEVTAAALLGGHPERTEAASIAGAAAMSVFDQPLTHSVAEAVAATDINRPPGSTTSTRPPANIPSSGGGTSSSPQTISGRIVLEHGLPASKLTIRLYQRGMGSKTLLREVETTESGEYGIALPGATNIEVHAVGSDGREVQLSETKFGLQPEERVDLIAPSALQPCAAEFTRLTAAVAPHTGGRVDALKDALELGGRKDFSYLANATGWDPGALAFASVAFSLADRTKIPADGLYAMARAGLPMDLRNLANVRTQTVANALRQAAAAGIVDAAGVESGIRAFREFAADFRFNNKIAGAVSSPKDFIGKTRLSDADRTAFSSVIREEEIENLWERAKAAGVSDAGIKRLQIQGKLAYLTFNNAELAAYLEAKISADPLELIELGYYEDTRWKDTLRELAGADENKCAALIPSLFTGRDVDERVDAYAAELSRRVRQMDPHAVTVDRIATAKMDGVPDADNVGKFLKNVAGKGFRLGKTPLSRFIDTNGSDLWNGIATEKQESTLATVRKLSSLYSVSPSDEAMNVLLAAGFTSATDIAMYSYDVFDERVGRFFPRRPKAGEKEVTEKIFWKAQQQAATIFNVFDGLKRLNSVPYAPGSSPQDAKKRDDQIVKVREKLAGLFPTLETLFGSVDYCECDHCQSVLSPAAYLVDLLYFIDPKEEAWATIKGAYKARMGVDYTKRKPFDVLNDRRPDIKNIALTCENTNVALPHIDIVNEVLEQLMMADQTPPMIEAYDVGEASSQDLIAEPQNILWSVYVGGDGKLGLRDLAYPIALPFDLPLEMVRAFLKQLDLPLWRLRELLVRPTSLTASSPARTDGWRDVWFERLGLSPGDVSALTSGDKWYELFGYQSTAETLATELVDGVVRPAETSLRNGKTLARRLGITYEELVDLVRTRFINPEIEAMITLNRLGVDPNTVDRFFGDGTPLSAAERSEFEANLRAQGVEPNDLRLLRTDTIRQSTLVLRSPSVGCDFALTTLAFEQDPADSEQAISLTLFKMNAFVRLKKKLGWEIHELDRALMALMPGVSSLSFGTWPEMMKTALTYLAHVEELHDHFENRLSREEILVLWSDIPTRGMSSLYERLFLSPAVLGRDPAFKKHLGHVLDGTALIADHVDGIRQALQLTEDEIEPLLSAAGATDRKLSIENLSILMRHAVLARGLELSITELIALLSLSERKPMSPLDSAPSTDLAKDIPWSETLAFIQEVELMREAGTDVAFIERICRHRGIVDEPIPDSDPVLLAVLTLSHEESTVPEKQQLVLVQTLAAQLSVPEGLIDNLLSNVLRDEAGKPLKEIGFSDSARTAVSLCRLRKTLNLVQSLGITDGELVYLTGNPMALNPNDLPTAEVTSETTAQSLRKGLTAWLDLTAARKQFGRSERLLAVLSAAKQSIDAANPLAAREKALLEAVAALTGRKAAWLDPALEAIGAKSVGASTFEVSALVDPAAVRRTIESLKCFIRLGLKPAEVVQFASMPIDDLVARKVRSSLKARYTASAWRRLVKPIFDSLRKKQRDALVAHLTHIMEDGKPKYGDTPERLFEYLLLDPGMEPVVVSSRIQAAISSVQLFVQRCLMNLEPDGVDPQIIDSKRWEWMRRYRVWEVNRKMFIWPENWLDPEFRDDKTHIFRDLEGKLLEGDVNDDLVRGALHDYLKGLEEIARLEMLTMYFEPGVSADSSIVHVVGRTQSGPHKYFYRKVSHGMWTPWEPIDVGIEGAHLVLTSWRGRMHLFWVTFLEETVENTTATSSTFEPSKDVQLSTLRAPTKVKIQLHWVEQIRGKWVNRSSTPSFVETAFNNLKATTEADKKKFFVRAVLVPHGVGIDDDDLEIHVTSEGKGHRFIFFSKLAPPAEQRYGIESPPPPFIQSASGANLERGGTKWKGSGALQAKFVSAVTQSSETGTQFTGSNTHRVLGGGTGFTLLYPSNETLPIPARTPPSGVGRPTGFIFGPQNAQHVAYRSSDGSIYDLFWTRNGWFYQSPSADADSADPTGEPEPAASDPHGYAVDDRGILCLAYAGATKVHELVWSQLDATLDDPEHLATGWHIETLYQAPTAGEQPQGRPYGGMFLPQRGVVFRTKDGNLRASVESSAGTWEIKELNAGLPRATSDPTGLLMTKTELGVTTIVSRHIFYLGNDGDVHELRSDLTGQNWSYSNITQAMPGIVKPAPDSNPAAYAFLSQNTLHVVYRGTDDRIHELWGFPGSWNYNAVGANFTKAKGDPAGYVTEAFGVQHIVYRGENDQVVELWWFGIWREHVLTKTVSGAPVPRSDLAGYSFESNRTQHVVYFAHDGSPQELWWNVDGWHHGKYALQNPFPDALGPLASPFFYESSGRDHTFFVEPYIVETTVHEWTAWIVTTREYVEPKLEIIPFRPLIPDAIAVSPSVVSIIKTPPLVTKKLFDDSVILRTPKGIIRPAIEPEPLLSDRIRLPIEKKPIAMVDVRHGRQPILERMGSEFMKGGFR